MRPAAAAAQTASAPSGPAGSSGREAVQRSLRQQARCSGREAAQRALRQQARGRCAAAQKLFHQPWRGRANRANQPPATCQPPPTCLASSDRMVAGSCCGSPTSTTLQRSRCGSQTSTKASMNGSCAGTGTFGAWRRPSHPQPGAHRLAPNTNGCSAATSDAWPASSISTAARR